MNTKHIKPEFAPTIEWLIDAQAAAKILGCRPSTVKALAKDGKLPGIQE